MFASSWPRVVAAVSALVFGTLLGASLLVSPPAAAVDLPIVGSEECDDAVSGVAAVVEARADVDAAVAAAADAAAAVVEATADRQAALDVLDALEPGDPVPPGVDEALADATEALEDATAAQAEADDALTAAQSALVNAEGAATASLCTTQVGDGTPKPTTPIVTPAPSTTVVVPPAPTIVVPAPVETQTVTRAPTAVVVELDPLADDGSVADTDGTQITIVPSGSVSTGGA